MKQKESAGRRHFARWRAPRLRRPANFRGRRERAYAARSPPTGRGGKRAPRFFAIESGAADSGAHFLLRDRLKTAKRPFGKNAIEKVFETEHAERRALFLQCNYGTRNSAALRRNLRHVIKVLP